MSPAAIAAVATIVAAALGVLGTVYVTLLRNSRKSPEQRAANDTGWEKLTGGLERRIESLEESDTAKTGRIEDLEVTVAELRAGIYQLQALIAWYARRVAQLVAFIGTHQLTPPPEEPRPGAAVSPQD